MDKQAVNIRNMLRLVGATLAAAMPASSWGLGLGEITLNSYLNEPLAAEVELLDVQSLTAEDVRVRLATQEAFDRLGVDRAYFLTSINFEVVIEGGVGKILLTTTKPLLEPYLDFLVETRWPDGRLLREYTVLVDLPSTPSGAPAADLGKDGGATSATEPSASAASGGPRLAQPETAPDRDYDRDAESRPRAGGRYLVQSNDTLWEIAAEAAPAGASIEQTMLATVQMNSDAFAGGNINGLKAGYVLEMPGERDILMSRSEAFAAVAQANDDWRNGIRRAPALRVVADDDLDPDQDEFDSLEDLEEESRQVMGDGDIADDDMALADVSAAGAEPEPETPFDDSQSVLPAEAGVSGNAVDGGPSSTELMEIQAQLSALSEQVGTLRELVVVKDQQIAALEAQLAAQQRQPAAAPPASVSQVAPAPSTVDSGYPWWLFALGGVALLAIGAVVYTRRLQRPVMVLKRTAPSVELEPAVSRPNELEMGDLPDQVDSPEGADGERGYGQRLHNDYVEENAVADAVAEADIYVAYGRYQQALNLLDAAAQTNPDDPAAVLKMVEIYLKNDRLEEARHAAQRLEGLGDGSAFGEASRMISDAESRADSGLDLGELAEPAGGSQSGNLDRLDAVDATPVLDLDLDLGVTSSAPAAAAAELESPGADLSLDVDLPMPDESVQQDPELPPELAQVLGDEGSSLAPEDSDGEDALVYAEDVDPIDTQLDLARAYIDMGDEDGARPVLNEVIAAGDLRQQAEARELLVSID